MRLLPPLFAALLFAVPVMASDAPVDKILILKKERRMSLLAKGKLVKRYKVQLGRNAKGPKVKRGDYRTPEGKYHIAEHHPGSQYHLALKISYPNRDDMRRAEKLGVDPGDYIMIHGEPNDRRKRRKDWTQGCIALTNKEIEEIYILVRDGTEVEIRP